MQKSQKVEVLFGDRAVWVNNNEFCLGRFGVYGIDVHSAIIDGEQHCLCCTHGEVGEADWRRFVEAMAEHHQVDLSGYPVPDFIPVKNRP